MAKALVLAALLFGMASFGDRAGSKVRLESELAKVRALPASDAKDAEEGRLLYWLSQYTDDRETKQQLVETGVALLEKIQAQDSNDLSRLIAWIALKGELATMKSKLVAITYLKPIEKAGLRLKSIDPKYGHYAGDRVLGRIYHLAPAFISIGSRSKARAHFEAALKGDGSYPENILFYAEFLSDIGETNKAHELAAAALKSPLLAQYPVERGLWQSIGQKVLGASE